MYVGGREAAIEGEMSSGPNRPSGSEVFGGGVIVIEGVVPLSSLVWAASRTWLGMLFKVDILTDRLIAVNECGE